MLEPLSSEYGRPSAQRDIGDATGREDMLLIALHAAHEELQALAARSTALEDALDAERAELHRLRQERRITGQLSTTSALHMFCADGGGGAPPQRPHAQSVPLSHTRHASPRHLEHPELTSVRQEARQQMRAARAAMFGENRPSTARARVLGGGGNGFFGRSPYKPPLIVPSPPPAAMKKQSAVPPTPPSVLDASSSMGASMERSGLPARCSTEPV
jgi:hypothetical protein